MDPQEELDKASARVKDRIIYGASVCLALDKKPLYAMRQPDVRPLRRIRENKNLFRISKSSAL